MGAEGMAALAKVLSDTQIQTLECVATEISRRESDTACYPTACLFRRDRVALRSLDNNQLCGLDRNGQGTFTLEGITPLCEAFTKMPSLTSVRCAA